MWSLMTRLLICCAFLIGAATSSQASPLGMFQMLEHSVECLAKSGTDSLTCANQRVPANPYLLPSLVIDDAMSLDPAKDYVWSHIESLDITQDLGMDCVDPRKWNFTSDTWYNLKQEDLNGDQHTDYLVAITCYNDLTYQGKSIRYDYQGLLWSNGFLSMFCGSEDGLYNCTEEVTPQGCD